MRTRKWRLTLSLANLILAVVMSAVGAHQAELDYARHRITQYLGYLPVAQLVSYCLNAPAFALVNLFRDFAMTHHLVPAYWFGVHCFYFVFYEYYVALFAF